MELVTLPQAWIAEGNPEEQRDIGEYFVSILDEHRLAGKMLFP
jgi:hypothetical protein